MGRSSTQTPVMEGEMVEVLVVDLCDVVLNVDQTDEEKRDTISTFALSMCLNYKEHIKIKCVE